MNDHPVEDIFGFIGGEECRTDHVTSDANERQLIESEIFAGPSKDAVIFCLDCAHLDKLMENSSTESQFQQVLRTLFSFMRNKVVASDGSDMTGLILYNVAKCENPLRQKGINLVQSLAPLSAKRIQEISRMIFISKERFIDKFGQGVAQVDISELLFVCNAQFKKTSASYRPRMFIFTDNDDPCGNDRRARKAARTRANDFHEGMGNGAEINLIPLVNPNETFDVSKFWKEIVLVSSSEDDQSFMENSIIQLSQLNDISLKKLFKKRPLNRINMYLGDLKIALMMYTSYLSASKPRHIYLDAATLKPLQAQTRYISDLTGAVLDPHVDSGEIMTFIEYQGRHIPMSRDDLVSIKQVEREIDSQGVTGSLHIIGFKPMWCLRPEHCVGHSCFLYPQDDRIKGSGVVSSGLIDRLHKRNLVAIARAVAKSNSALQFVALVPQPEIIDPETGRQDKSPGFFMIRLPFADDIRDLNLPDTNVGSTMSAHPEMEKIRRGQVEKAKAVIDSMTEPHWEPDMLDNPSLKVCYSVLEALALGSGSEEVEEVADLLNPDPEKVDLADLIVPEWLQSLNMADTNACAGTINTTVYRKTKVEEKVWTEDEVGKLSVDGMLEGLLVDQLRQIVQTVPKLQHLSHKGRKAELIQKIRANI